LRGGGETCESGALGPGGGPPPPEALAGSRRTGTPSGGRGSGVTGPGRIGLSLFVGTSFAAAFLIFLVQPMVGKRILPWFGGVPAVWMLCLAFYQTTLFAGYAYAHILIRTATPRAQIAVHAILFAVALLALPVLPSDAWQPTDSVAPRASILAMLAFHVTLPFLVLAATAPLVQAWFARGFPARSPYPLYAVSNGGSLLALLAYPFAIEPRLALSTTGGLWSLGFALTGASVLACALLVERRGAAPAPTAGEATPFELGRSALWILLAGCAVVLLMGVSNELCLDVASVPFLWILPLAVYLTSFVLCFGFERVYRRLPYVVATAVALVSSAWRGGPLVSLADSLALQIALYALLLFGLCMLLHGELYRLRPAARDLTAFYLCVSGGGALGGLFVGLAAPHIFDDYYELHVGLVGAWLLLLAAWWRDPRVRLWRKVPLARWSAAAALTVLALGLAVSSASSKREGAVYRERTFFGVLRVLHKSAGVDLQRVLFHGRTMHGVQFAAAEERPTGYYGPETGIGWAQAQRPPGVPLRVGVVGLGVGTLAAYGRPGDRFRFYEIDPAVIQIARDPRHFTYLASSAAEIEVVEGDGRISLAAERAREVPRFDILVIDAYSSDAVPIHLLTREALALYLDALEESGLLAVHASSLHFNLVPLLARLGASAGLPILAVRNAAMPYALSARATWVFLSRDAARVRSLERFVRGRQIALGRDPDAVILRPTSDELVAAPLWTDDYSDLFAALKPLRRSKEH